MILNVEPDLKRLRTWVHDAQVASADWRAESWRDQEMYDGGKAQWTEEDWDEAEDAGITPLTINRTFPTINLILGTQAINKLNIVAKGRTQEDSEISQVMNEGIRFVLDQNNGEFKISEAFRNQIISGFGCLAIKQNPDPRYERIQVVGRDWKQIGWDPFGSPWFEPGNCRYAYYQPWMDLEDLMGLFPRKAKELKDHFEDLTEPFRSEFDSFYYDEATMVEEQRQMLIGTQWADANRRRVRPVEMYYPAYSKGWFAVFPDGRVVELKDNIDPIAQYQIVRAAREVVAAVVRRMKTVSFLGDLELVRGSTPYPHDEYPLVPFVGYLDRWGYPYGVPRQIRGQDEEVNKRRSMALALLKSRRVIAEKDVVDGGEEGLQQLYDEANSLDGFLVVNPGKSDKIKIQEQGQLTPSQVALLEQSEREIEEVSGANPEMAGYEGRVLSAKAIRERKQSAITVTAPLFDNLRRSHKILGNLIVSMIQGFWTGEKVLRITDRLTGADRFVALNQYVQGNDGVIRIKNNITQGKYDLIISEAPPTDTVREQNLNLIIEAVKKSPPEVIPHLMNLAFEMSELPNKEELLARIRPILGIPPGDEDLSPQEIKAKALKELEAQKEEAQRQKKIKDIFVMLEGHNKKLENEKLEAEINRIRANVEKIGAGIDRDDADSDTRLLEVLGKIVEKDEKGRTELLKLVQSKGEKPAQPTATAQ